MRTLLTILSIAVVSAVPAQAAESAFAVQKVGSGRPMILLPGLMSSGEVWSTTVDRYKDEYELHVLTFAGFAGQSALPDGEFLPVVREAVVRYIREQHLDRPIIVGHSLGGFLGFWIAASAPSLIGGLIAVDGVPFLSALMNPAANAGAAKAPAAQLRELYRSLTSAQLVAQTRLSMSMMMKTESDLQRVLGWVAASDSATAGQATYEMMVTDLRKEVSRITVPVLLVGAGALATDHESGARLRSAYEAQVIDVPHHSVVMADRARHFVMFDAPDDLWSAMDAFLEKLLAVK
jgi:pimeloyl-ACP methyl ester carboxylesterase